MEIEAGKYYKTRGGEKAFVACVRDDLNGGCDYPIYGYRVGKSGIMLWKKDGIELDMEHSNDLIEEWKEPKRITVTIALHIDGAITFLYGTPPPTVVGTKTITIFEGVFE